MIQTDCFGYTRCKGVYCSALNEMECAKEGYSCSFYKSKDQVQKERLASFLHRCKLDPPIFTSEDKEFLGFKPDKQ